MMDVVETRRRFMAHFAGAGLGATLVPGVLWARMQDAGASQVTLDSDQQDVRRPSVGRTLLIPTSKQLPRGQAELRSDPCSQ